MGRVGSLRAHLRERGVSWTALYAARRAIQSVLQRVDARIIAIERRRFITGPSTVSAAYHTVEENRVLWNQWDWSQLGEEWTEHARNDRGLDPQEWKQALIDRMLRKYVQPGQTVLEIGPGAGRWSAVLAPLCQRLILADIAEQCLVICRKRFADRTNIEYHLITDGTLGFVPDESLDAVWSYDVFVHINPTDIERYLAELSRILKLGGVAVIHHAGEYASQRTATEGFRSHMNAAFFAHLVGKHGLNVVEQDQTLPHIPGDVISVVRR
jgi:SAM-dependent methyltransferase